MSILAAEPNNSQKIRIYCAETRSAPLKISLARSCGRYFMTLHDLLHISVVRKNCMVL